MLLMKAPFKISHLSKTILENNDKEPLPARTLNSCMVKFYFDNFVKSGISREVLLKKTGISPEILEKADARISLSKYHLLYKTAVELSKDPAFILKTAEQYEPERFGILDNMLKCCKNLYEANHQRERFYRLMATQYQISFIRNDNEFSILFIPEDQQSYFPNSEEALSVEYIISYKKLTKKAIFPLEVHYTFPKPSYYEEYLRIFQCPVLFNQKQSRMIFDLAVEDIPIPTYNSYLHSFLTQHASEKLEKLNALLDNTLSNKVSKIIMEEMSKGEVSIEKVAERMFSTRKNIYVKLKEEGTSFSELLQNIRKELAKSYLDQSDLSITDIAYILGYSESSTFYRAFKKWYNQTPKDYRATLNR